MQLGSIGRSERDVLVLKALRTPVAPGKRRDRVYEPRLKKHHGQHDQEIYYKQRPGDSPQTMGCSAPRRIGGLVAHETLVAVALLVNRMKERIDVFVFCFLIQCPVQQPSGFAIAVA